MNDFNPHNTNNPEVLEELFPNEIARHVTYYTQGKGYEGLRHFDFVERYADHMVGVMDYFSERSTVAATRSAHRHAQEMTYIRGSDGCWNSSRLDMRNLADIVREGRSTQPFSDQIERVFDAVMPPDLREVARRILAANIAAHAVSMSPEAAASLFVPGFDFSWCSEEDRRRVDLGVAGLLEKAFSISKIAIEERLEEDSLAMLYGATARDKLPPLENKIRELSKRQNSLRRFIWSTSGERGNIPMELLVD